MKNLEDEDFIAKQLFDAKSGNINKLLKRYIAVKNKSSKV